MKFYPADWRADPMLRNCSLTARGLWLEMLALMHDSERYGYLLVNGKPPSNRQLAIQAGALFDEVPGALSELEAEGVFSRDKNGTIYSRRMIRDEKKAEHARKIGKKGGNPRLSKQTHNSTQDNRHDNGEDKGSVKPQIPEARYQSNSVDKSTGANGAGNDPESDDFDPVKALFDDGVRILGSSGTVEKSARSLIGRWRRDFGDDLVALAIAAAESRSISEPVAWIPKFLAARAARSEPDHYEKDDLVAIIHREYGLEQPP